MGTHKPTGVCPDCQGAMRAGSARCAGCHRAAGHSEPATCLTCGCAIPRNARYCGTHRALGQSPRAAHLLDVPARVLCPTCGKRAVSSRGEECPVCDAASRYPTAVGTGQHVSGSSGLKNAAHPWAHWRSAAGTANPRKEGT